MTDDLLHVRRNGTGPIIVLLHGVAGSGAFWDPVVPVLEKKFEVVRLDLLGYGHSPKPKITYSVENHVTAIQATLIKEGIDKPFAVVGLSMGTLLWLDYANRYPDQLTKLIGVGLPYYRDRAEAERLITHDRWARLALNHPLVGGLWISTLWWFGRHSRILRKRIAPAYYSDTMTQESLMNPAYALRSTIINCMVNNLAPQLLEQNKDKQILLIHGEQDEWSSVQNIREAAAQYSNITLEILPGVRHNTVLVAPDRTGAAIMRFLSQA